MTSSRKKGINHLKFPISYLGGGKPLETEHLKTVKPRVRQGNVKGGKKQKKSGQRGKG